MNWEWGRYRGVLNKRVTFLLLCVFFILSLCLVEENHLAQCHILFSPTVWHYIFFIRKISRGTKNSG